MHRLLILACFMVLSMASVAQENRSSLINAKIKDGTVMLGGNLTGSYQKYSKASNNQKGDLITARFTTKSGYFFWPDIAIGLNAFVEYTNLNISDSIQSTQFGGRTTDLLAGPFVRYYFNSGLFTELNLNAGVHTVKGGIKSDIKSGALGIGYAYFLSDQVAIEPLLSIDYRQNQINVNNKISKDHQFGPVLSIGIQAYIWSPTRVLPTK